jgi:hypothetical protein
VRSVKASRLEPETLRRRSGSRLLRLVALGLLAYGCSPAGPDPNNRLTPEEAARGWKLLFDGRTLAGWEDPAAETPPGDAWIVEDGCIKAVDHPRLREDLLTLERFGDFELVFDWKTSPGGNSGVKYRIQDRAVLVEGRTNPHSSRFEDKVDYELAHRLGDRSRLGPQDRIEEYLIGFEYQLIDNRGHADALVNADRTAGAVYGLAAPDSDATLPVGQFNRSRILLRGNRVTHWLNGRRVLEVGLDSEAIRSRLELRWSRSSPVYRCLAEMPQRETPIALQHHNDEVWFRNLKIRRLEP